MQPLSSSDMDGRAVFAGRNENEIIARYLAEAVRPNAFDTGIQFGMYFTDSDSAKLSTTFQLELTHALESAGIRVVFCGLNEFSVLKPAVRVQDALTAICGKQQLRTRAELRAGNRTRSSASSIDDEWRSEVSDMVVVAVDLLACDLILVIDGIEQLLDDINGRSMLAGLQNAREIVNAREGTAGHFLLVGIGTDDLTLDRLALGCVDSIRRRRKV